MLHHLPNPCSWHCPAAQERVAKFKTVGERAIAFVTAEEQKTDPATLAFNPFSWVARVPARRYLNLLLHWVICSKLILNYWIITGQIKNNNCLFNLNISCDLLHDHVVEDIRCQCWQITSRSWASVRARKHSSKPLFCRGGIPRPSCGKHVPCPWISCQVVDPWSCNPSSICFLTSTTSSMLNEEV